jgi:hypothetical protein
VIWRRNEEYVGASLALDARGVAIDYHECDPVGRFGKVVASERANFAPVVLRSGLRRFLLCPGCNRRCRILYSGRERLRGQLCHDLRYASQNMGELDRSKSTRSTVASIPLQGFSTSTNSQRSQSACAGARRAPKPAARCPSRSIGGSGGAAASAVHVRRIGA